MATELKLRRGTTSQHSSFTGAEAEVTVDTDKETVVVHDGVTAGGYAIAREDMSNVPDGSISGNQIEGGTIDATNIDMSGATFTLADGQLSGSKLQDNSISGDKIISLAATEVTYDNSSSGFSATDAQAAIDETADETGLALIQDGVDPSVARAVAYNDIGAPVAGGYFAGVIDTIKGTIDSQDDYQTGQRYALIVAPKELEGGRGSSPAAGLTTGDLQWDTARTTAGEAGALTRWNGLEATNAIIAKNNTNYQAHDFIEECRNQYPAPATTGGSEWYLPAMDELELLYRNFKPNYADNRTDTRTRNFPGSNPSGFNPSSDPTGSNYSNNPRVPEKTPALGFRETEAAAIDKLEYWSTTDADEGGRAWRQRFTSSGAEGLQAADIKDGTIKSVRPVRRVVL